MSPALRKLIWALALLAAALVLLVLAVGHVLRDPLILEQYASKLLQREVRIGELHEIRFDREPSFVVEGLSIANPAWAEQPHFLSLRRARVHLDLPSLWRDGPLVISDLELEGLQLALLQREGESPNWQFGDEKAADTAGNEEELALPVLLEQAHIRDSAIIYRTPDADLHSRLEGQLHGAKGIVLTVDGRWRDQPLRVSGQVEQVGPGLQLAGEGEYRGWQATVEGALADPLAFTGLDLQLQLQGQPVLPVAAQAPARRLPLALQIHVNGSGRKLDVSRGLLVSGDSQLTINGTLGNPASLRGLDLDLVFDSPDLKALLPVSPANELPVQVALQTRLRSDGATLRLEKLSARSGGARLWGDISLPMQGGLAGSLLSLRAEGASTGELLAPWTGQPVADLPFELDLEGRWQDPQWQLQTFQLNVGESHLDAALSLTPQAQGIAGTGRIQLSGKHALRALAALGLTARLPNESFMLRSAVDLGADGALQLTDLDLQLGRSDLSGQLSYAPGSPARVDAQLHAGKLDLRFLTDAIQRQLQQADSGSSDAAALESGAPLSAAQQAERLIPDTALDMSWLDAVEGELSLDIDEVIAEEGIQSSASFHLRLADGRLESDEMQWQGSFSTGQASLLLAHAAPGAQFELRLQSHRLPLIWLVTGNSGAEQQADYRMALSGSGASLRQLAASLDGSVYLRGNGGKIDNNGLNLVLGDVFGEIVSRINPFVEREPYTQVECHAGGLLLEDGLATLAPGLVIRTDKIDIALGGTVDLNSEQLDMVFNTRSRTGIGISASKALTPYLKLGGNFTYPRLGVNPTGVVVSGGAAFATGGLSILAEGMWDRWVATSVNPCEALFKQDNKVESELKKLFGRPL
ncbi:hypothetical protein DWB85_02125 [Seongchinamella sediminis]|uniref:Uncharacterized protein n=1 Tax=Seongchinamella sediminis TaxID=2283635 RepID=A0A3L7E4I5_9GAMM|nr:AsmA-like C-terminal region-containing protein [Seongchinamella sediminis]RLQ23372.1 hypothetical protein DWB85_02125 [Seongchinamella sediminis]